MANQFGLTAALSEALAQGAPLGRDAAGATRTWLAHLRAQRCNGGDLEFLVGFTMITTVQAAIRALPKQAWAPAINADGSPREGADVAELTGMLGGPTAAPARPRPGHTPNKPNKIHSSAITALLKARGEERGRRPRCARSSLAADPWR